MRSDRQTFSSFSLLSTWGHRAGRQRLASVLPASVQSVPYNDTPKTQNLLILWCVCVCVLTELTRLWWNTGALMILLSPKKHLLNSPSSSSVSQSVCSECDSAVGRPLLLPLSLILFMLRQIQLSGSTTVCSISRLLEERVSVCSRSAQSEFRVSPQEEGFYLVIWFCFYILGWMSGTSTRLNILK